MVTRTTRLRTWKTTQRRTGHENTSRPFGSDRCGHRRFYDQLGYSHDYRWEAGQMNRKPYAMTMHDESVGADDSQKDA